MNTHYRRLRTELRACVRALGEGRHAARRKPRELSYVLYRAGYDAGQRGQAELAALCSALFELARLAGTPPATWRRAEFSAAAASTSAAVARYYRAQRSTDFSGAAGPEALTWVSSRAVYAVRGYLYNWE